METRAAVAHKAGEKLTIETVRLDGPKDGEVLVEIVIATDKARENGKTYLVASAPQPSPAVYIFACDHPDARNVGTTVMYQLTPAGERIPHTFTPR